MPANRKFRQDWWGGTRGLGSPTTRDSSIGSPTTRDLATGLCEKWRPRLKIAKTCR